jgi:phospholipase/carboxylesterase
MRTKFPSEHTILFGFSQGCLMTLETGLRYPHKLAGLVGVSGYVHDDAALVKELSPVAREQKILWTHGTRDPLIPMAAVRGQMEALKLAGLSIQWEEFPKEHTIAPREVEVIREFVIGALARGSAA